MNLNETLERVHALLAQEEGVQPVVSRAIVDERTARRTQIREEMAKILKEFNALQRRLNELPRLPDLSHIEWAQSVLHFPNLTFLVLDTTGVDYQSDIIRVYVADAFGQPVFDQVVQPGRQIGAANTTYTGILPEELQAAPTLAWVWDSLRTVLTGRFILAYNLEFVQQRLTENAEHYGLPAFPLIGEDLQDRAQSYFSSYKSRKLVDCCKSIGHPLPNPPMAPDRADGQLALLLAMSQGITSVAIDEDEDNPF